VGCGIILLVGVPLFGVPQAGRIAACVLVALFAATALVFTLGSRMNTTSSYPTPGILMNT
jgi:hypothetical protein